MGRFSRNVTNAVRDPHLAVTQSLRRAGVFLSTRHLLGTNVFTRDWDLLLVLDAARVDALRDVADEYSLIDDVRSIRSVGSHSAEWVANTFDRKWTETLQKTAYVTCNPLGQHLIEDRGDRSDGASCQDYFYQYSCLDLVESYELGHLEHVWKEVDDDDRFSSLSIPGLTPPRYLTDRGISLMRGGEFDRVILHYIQPHHPYTANALGEDRDLHDYEEEPFDYLERTSDSDTVYEAYLDELRYVLDDIELLLDNVDSDSVVITADHGEAFGEYGVYQHPPGSLHPTVRHVPWIRTTATDSGTYEPEYEPRDDNNEYSVKNALSDLGYIEH